MENVEESNWQNGFKCPEANHLVDCLQLKLQLQYMIFLHTSSSYPIYTEICLNSLNSDKDFVYLK